MSSTGKPIGILAVIHPKSQDKREKILKTLPVSFFRKPDTNCTTWCYFTPSTRKGALKGLFPDSEVSPIVGLEIFTSTAALSSVQQSREFKDHAAAVERDGLHAKPEELTAWYPTAGFVARPDEQETGKAQIVVLAKFVAKDGPGNKEKLVEVLGNYCNWVRDNEPTTLTYAVLTRPKAPNEVMLFERYRDLPAIGAHGKTPQFKAMFKGTGPYIQGKQTRLAEFEEVDGSFVGNVPGGAGEPAVKASL